MLRLCDAVHHGHLDVGEDDFIAHITARFRHVCVIHVDSDKPVGGLVALAPELILSDSPERHDVECEVIDKQYLGFATAAASLVFFLLIGLRAVLGAFIDGMSLDNLALPAKALPEGA